MMEKQRSLNRARLIIVFVIVGVLVALVTIYLSRTVKDSTATGEESGTNTLIGIWNCAKGDGDLDNLNDTGNYINTIELNADSTYRFGKYGDLDNNHYSGIYRYTKSNNTVGKDAFDYKTVNLKVNEYVIDGVKQSDHMDKTGMEMGISKTDNKKAVVFFASSDSVYYCYNENSEVTENEH